MELGPVELPPASGPVKGFVSTAPTGLAQPMEVIVPSFSADHSYEIRRWSARGLTVPKVGDEVLLIEDENGIPWVASWWPAAGDVPISGTTFPPLTLVRAATSVALATNTAPTTTTLQASANGALAAQDGVSLAVGDRILVKNEVAAAHNGPYEVTSLGAAGSKWLLTRIPTANASAEFLPGMKIVAAEGTQNGGVTFGLLTTGAIVLGTTALTFGYANEWVAPALLNSWANYETAGSNMEVAYRRAPDGRVTIRGLIKHAGSLSVGETSTVFVLPTGFRPSKEMVFPGFESSTSGFTIAANIVFANGEVLFVPALTAAVGYASLNLSFYAD